MSELCVLTENLSKDFENASGPVKAVSKVDLEVRRGEFVSITGPTGSGKTTLLNLIGAMTRPSEGMVFIEDRYLGGLQDGELSRFRGSKIGFVYQFASLVPSLNVIENVSLPARLIGTEAWPPVLKKAQDLLGMVGLSGKRDGYPAELSGGEQRRVAIARAFINDPLLVLADEPTGDLDEQTEQEMFDLFRRFNRERGITFILVTHNTGLAKKSDRFLTMKEGSL